MKMAESYSQDTLRVAEDTYERNLLLGRERRKIVYAKEFKEGYVFGIHSKPENVETHVRRYWSQGLEVFVGDRAFAVNGIEISDQYKTLLVRSRKTARESSMIRLFNLVRKK